MSQPLPISNICSSNACTESWPPPRANQMWLAFTMTIPKKRSRSEPPLGTSQQRHPQRRSRREPPLHRTRFAMRISLFRAQHRQHELDRGLDRGASQAGRLGTMGEEAALSEGACKGACVEGTESRPPPGAIQMGWRFRGTIWVIGLIKKTGVNHSSHVALLRPFAGQFGFPPPHL